MTKLHNPYQSTLGYWVKRLENTASKAIDARLAAAGIGRSQWRILYHVQRNGTVGQAELRVFLSVESATMSGFVDALIRKQWLEKRPDKDDGRARTLQITPRGEAVLRAIPDPFAAVSRQMMRGISDAQAAMAIDILAQAVHNIEQQKEGL